MVMEDVVRPVPKFESFFRAIADDTELYALCTLGPQRDVGTTLPIRRHSQWVPASELRHMPTLARVLLATLETSKGVAWVNS